MSVFAGLFTAGGQRMKHAVEPPPAVLRLVKQKHPNFGLRFNGITKAWMVTWTWDEKDPRRKHVQQGHTPPEDAHDIVGDLPPDCPVESAAAWIDAHCIVNPEQNAWQGVVESQARANRVREMLAEEQALADVQNRIELSARNSTLRPLFTEGLDELDDVAVEGVEQVSDEERAAILRGEV